MKFIRRVSPDSLYQNQDVNISIGGGSDSDTVENVLTVADQGLEVELEDGSVFVLLGYLRK